MAETWQYAKKRKFFGRPPCFEDTDTKIVGCIPPEEINGSHYQVRDPNRIILSNIPQLSEHSVNTERIPIGHKGMKHLVGGWPTEFRPDEPNEVQKYMKKMYRDNTYGFASATKDMSERAIKIIKQNNEIDLFEEYFAGEQAEHISETLSTKTLMIFKDPNPVKRSATKIAWYPDNNEMKVGVTYSILRFQQMPDNMPKESYIWNLKNPNSPEKTLIAHSPLCSMAFNPKQPEIIVAGSYNGQISWFDTRKEEPNQPGVCKPFLVSELELSHHDPVYNVDWVHTKSGTECVSTSTDGRMLWWDYKNEGAKNSFNQLTPDKSQYVLREKVPDKNTGEEIEKVLGISSLCYNVDAGPLKFLLGSEQGYMALANKKGKEYSVNWRYGFEGGKHHGPVYALQRNPQCPKMFLSVGDWSAKIWHDEQVTPIMQTRFHSSYLTDGCWSNTRPGLFFLTRIDGFMDVWDFYYRQNEVAFSQKVSDSPLTSIAVNQNMCAIGDAEGTVSIMQLCRPLYEPANREKDEMVKIFDREYKREKTLYVSKKQERDNAEKNKKAEKGKPKKTPEQIQAEKDANMKQKLQEIEENFFKIVSQGS